MFSYDVIEDLMNNNEADQAYSLISRTNTNNLMRFRYSVSSSKEFSIS